MPVKDDNAAEDLLGELIYDAKPEQVVLHRKHNSITEVPAPQEMPRPNIQSLRCPMLVDKGNKQVACN